MIRGFVFVLVLSSLGVSVAAWGSEDSLRPTVPLTTSKKCPATILVPFSLKKPCGGTHDSPDLRGCKGVWIEPNCAEWATYENREYATLDLTYFQYNLEHNEFLKHIQFDLHHESLDQFVRRGAGRELVVSAEDEQVVLDANGVPQLASPIGACGQEKKRKVDVKPISGENWKGWAWEQSFSAPEKKLTDPYCKKFTPNYRCVTLIFGNDKVSALFPAYCFLRKKVDHLDDELSFDVFMDMVKTIRFKEGAVIQ